MTAVVGSDAVGSYELLGHDADVRAVVRGPDYPALCDAAVALVRRVLVGDSPVEPREERVLELDLAGLDEEERLFRLTRELVYLSDAERFLPAEVTGLDPPTVAGEPFDPARHASAHQIKALTRHRYALRRDDDGLSAELVFDL